MDNVRQARPQHRARLGRAGFAGRLIEQTGLRLRCGARAAELCEQHAFDVGVAERVGELELGAERVTSRRPVGVGELLPARCDGLHLVEGYLRSARAPGAQGASPDRARRARTGDLWLIAKFIVPGQSRTNPDLNPA